MAPYVVETLVRQRQQQLLDEAARRHSRNRQRPRAAAWRLAVGRALVDAGGRLAGRPDWSGRPAATAGGRS